MPAFFSNPIISNHLTTHSPPRAATSPHFSGPLLDGEPRPRRIFSPNKYRVEGDRLIAGLLVTAPLFHSTELRAQEVSSALIRGVVTDPTGAAVAAAQVNTDGRGPSCKTRLPVGRAPWHAAPWPDSTMLSYCVRPAAYAVNAVRLASGPPSLLINDLQTCLMESKRLRLPNFLPITTHSMGSTGRLTFWWQGLAANIPSEN